MGERMYYVLKILCEHDGYVTRNEINNELQKYNIKVSSNTILSIVNEVNAFFYNIFNTNVIESVKKKGYKVVEDYFSVAQLQLLVDSIAFQRDLDANDKIKIINKLLRISPNNRKKIIERNIVDEHLPFSMLVTLNNIITGINDKKGIKFGYVDYKLKENRFVEDSGEERRVTPYYFTIYNNHYYLVCYNKKKKKDGPTIYRIDRIRQSMTTYKSSYDGSQWIEEDDIEAIEKKTINMFVGDNVYIDLKIKFHKKISREIVSRFSNDIIVEKIDDNYYQTTIINEPMSDGLMSWILMLGDKIQVIEPLELKDKIKENIQNMLKQYN